MELKIKLTATVTIKTSSTGLYTGTSLIDFVLAIFYTVNSPKNLFPKAFYLF